MSLYGYYLMCPKCKEIAEFQGGVFSKEKDIMLFNCCQCVPQIKENEMIEATQEAELNYWKLMSKNKEIKT